MFEHHFVLTIASPDEILHRERYPSRYDAERAFFAWLDDSGRETTDFTFEHAAAELDASTGIVTTIEVDVSELVGARLTGVPVPGLEIDP